MLNAHNLGGPMETGMQYVMIFIFVFVFVFVFVFAMVDVLLSPSSLSFFV